MPQSKKRHHAHPQQQHHQPQDNKSPVIKTNRLVKAIVILFSVIGLLISYLIAGADITWLIVGTAIGAVTGYFFGKQMNKTLSK